MHFLKSLARHEADDGFPLEPAPVDLGGELLENRALDRDANHVRVAYDKIHILGRRCVIWLFFSQGAGFRGCLADIEIPSSCAAGAH
jgi:hypothetical protein